MHRRRARQRSGARAGRGCAAAQRRAGHRFAPVHTWPHARTCLPRPPPPSRPRTHCKEGRAHQAHDVSASHCIFSHTPDPRKGRCPLTHTTSSAFRTCGHVHVSRRHTCCDTAQASSSRAPACVTARAARSGRPRRGRDGPTDLQRAPAWAAGWAGCGCRWRGWAWPACTARGRVTPQAGPGSPARCAPALRAPGCGARAAQSGVSPPRTRLNTPSSPARASRHAGRRP